MARQLTPQVNAVQVRRAVETPPDRQRTCESLHFLLGLPVEAIASLIGLLRGRGCGRRIRIRHDGDTRRAPRNRDVTVNFIRR